VLIVHFKAFKFKVILILTIIVSVSFITLFKISASRANQVELYKTQKIFLSETKTYPNKLWVENPTFSNTITPWYSSKDGDPSDVLASNSTNQANFEILGEKYDYDFYSDLTQDSNWNKSKNPNFPAYPDTAIINASGACVSHYWDESADQSVAVNWNRILTMPVNMSDYVITSANLTAIFNATVQATPSIDDNYPNEFTGAIDVLSDSGVDTNPTGGYFQGSTGDYVRFYVWISDPANNSVFEVAYNQTTNLGQDSPLIDHLDDTVMVTIPENIFIFYLTTVLGYDFNNFRISIGMRIWCEDNFGQDADNWQLLIIKSVNLKFTYEKNIDQFTSLSWNQDLKVINGTNVQITDASLNFQYKIDGNWTDASQNSQIRIFFNDRKYEQAISLIDYIYSPNFQDASANGFNIVSKILPYEAFTLSIRVFLAEDFRLDHNITISITNVYLYISYTETFPDFIPEPWFFAGLFIIAAIAAIATVGYLIAYQTYLKYPVPVRKVRKYRKTLLNEKDPSVSIFERKRSFNRLYQKELDKTAKSLSGAPVDGKIVQDKVLGKGPTNPKNIKNP
jgi:hypothetical protein